MTEKNRSVVFRGDIVIGKNLLEVKQKLKQIFKVNDARIDSLFVGKPVPLKTNLSQPEAEKYKTILHQAGIVVSIESASDKKTESPSVKKAQENTPPSNRSEDTANNTDTGEWKLAPVGSLLQDNKAKPAKSIEVNVEHLSVLPQEGNLLADDERQPELHSDIDTEALEWELTPYGESLLKETEKKKITPIDVDVTSLSLAENNGNLLKESERKKVEVLDVDTSHLQLVPDEQALPGK